MDVYIYTFIYIYIYKNQNKKYYDSNFSSPMEVDLTLTSVLPSNKWCNTGTFHRIQAFPTIKIKSKNIRQNLQNKTVNRTVYTIVDYIRVILN
jgi:hypothetical protein